MDRVIIDTNIFVSAVMSAANLTEGGAARAVLRAALRGEIRPVFGNALFSEYEDVLSRKALFASCPVPASDREDLFNALLSVSDWTPIYFLWRPNLPDEADNHVMELAVAGGAQAIITGNVRDFLRAELAFPSVRILTAAAYLNWRRTR